MRLKLLLAFLAIATHSFAANNSSPNNPPQKNAAGTESVPTDAVGDKAENDSVEAQSQSVNEEPGAGATSLQSKHIGPLAQTVAPLKMGAISFHPISMLASLLPGFKWLAIDTEFGVSDKISVGPTFTYIGLTLDTLFQVATGSDTSRIFLKAWPIGVRTNFFLSHRRFESGLYAAIEPDFVFAKVGDSTETLSMHYWILNGFLGYGWYFPTGATLRLGVGPAYYSAPKSVTSSKTGESFTVPGTQGFAWAGEFTFGWTF